MLVLYLLLLSVASCSAIQSEESLAVTIYNDNFAMVKDVRNISFDKGQSFLYFTDVSENIQTETVTFKAIDDPTSIRVYEQNFEKNLVSPDGILKKYINREIDIVAEFGSEVKRITGTLLSYSPSFIIQTKKNGVVIAQKVTAIELPALPDGFFTLPTLNWKVWSQKQQTTSCEVAYRTTGFSWKSDYTLVLDESRSKGDIGGWVSIDNNSGKKYLNAKLKLIAGDVNVIQPQPIYYKDYLYAEDESVAFQGGAGAGGAPQFSSKSFADYHLYTLSQPVTLNQSSQKQVEFIPKVYGVPLRRYNELLINTGGYSNEKITLQSKVQFNNSAQNGLGIPFPKGTFRAFQEDPDDGSLEFIGEDSIDHTPKNENITLLLGNSFDITASLLAKQRTSFGDRGGFIAEMALLVKNHKNEEVQVEILLSNYYGDNLKIKYPEANVYPLEKVSATQYKIVLIIPADQQVQLQWNETYAI